MDTVAPRVTVHLMLRAEWKVLLARRFLTRDERGKYGLIFAELEAGETLTEALIREAREGIGILLDPKDLRLVHVMHRQVENGLDCFFLAKSWSGEPLNLDPEKYDDLSWYELGRLPESTVPYVKIALMYARDDVPYSEFGTKKTSARAAPVGMLQHPDRPSA
jgi:8-oxo-dGTP diphosphatase